MAGPPAPPAVVRNGLRVVLAPDSFKGTATARQAAEALAAGWSAERPEDELLLRPMADGGEGTLDAVLAAMGAPPRTTRVHLPGGRAHEARWALVGDRAVVELAECCGLPLLGDGDPMGAGTEPLGEVLADALDAGAAAVLLGVGGSASTDGGAGALRALGLRVRDASGRDVGPGGAGLAVAVDVDDRDLRPPPRRGVEILCDVTAPLLGPTGAAAVYGPQKGASPEQVAVLDEALRQWHRVLGGDAERPGAGAAGGTPYGLATLWGAALVPGAESVARLVGLDAAVRGADLVLTGEGSFDASSLAGKATGHVLDVAARAGCRAGVVAGRLAITAPAGVATWSLEDLAGGLAPALAEPLRWLERAGRLAAHEVGSDLWPLGSPRVT